MKHRTRTRALSWLLSLALVLSLIPAVGVTALAADEHNHDGYTAWTSEYSLPTEPGDYYLTKDVTLRKVSDEKPYGWSVPKGDTNLCLNGHSIQLMSANCSLIKVPEDATLNLYDCGNQPRYVVLEQYVFQTEANKDAATVTETSVNGDGTGTVVVNGGYIAARTGVGEAGGIRVESGGEFNMHGGTILGITGSNGGAVRIYGTFNMSGGQICYNKATGHGGAGVRIMNKTTKGTMTMSGTAMISNNYASGSSEQGQGRGGGIWVDVGGTLTMSGGTVTDNKTAKYGGGIYVNSGAVFNLDGGTINGNTSTLDGGGIYIMGLDEGENIPAGILNVSGQPVISNNTATGDGGGICVSGTMNLSGAPDISGNKKKGDPVDYNNNVYLPSEKTINVTDALSNENPIGVTTKTTPTEQKPVPFTTGWKEKMPNTDPAKFFTSDNKAYIVGLNSEGEAFLGRDDDPSTVTFNANGGAPTPAEQIVPSGGVAAVPKDLGKTGYDFEGWYWTEAFEKDTKVGDTYEATADTTLYAKWTPTDYEIKCDTVVVKYNIESTDTLPAAPDNPGHTFAGWQVTEPDGSWKADAKWNAGDSLTGQYGNPTLTAQWTVNVYTVDFDTVGGTPVPAKQTVEYNSTVEKPADPTYEGYTFDGWYWTSDYQDNSKVDFSSYKITDDTTFFAKWTEDSASEEQEQQEEPASSGHSGTTTYPVNLPDQTDGGKITVKPARASEGSQVTVTPTPDEGYQVDKVTVTDKDGNPVEVKDNGDGTYTFKMPKGGANVKATFVKDEGAGEKFVDVPKDAWYHDAVYWAVDKGITEGVDATHFAPDASCTRAQMVTFLWRAAGKPAPTSADNPFTDVKEGAYYYDAVLWGVEKGIVKGTSETTFSPDAAVTRAQTVTFLYRYEQSEGGGFTGAWAFPLNYSDAADVPEWAYESFCWMTMHEVVQGSNGKLLPNDKCLRSQIVTMMERYFNSAEA